MDTLRRPSEGEAPGQPAPTNIRPGPVLQLPLRIELLLFLLLRHAPVDDVFTNRDGKSVFAVQPRGAPVDCVAIPSPLDLECEEIVPLPYLL